MYDIITTLVCNYLKDSIVLTDTNYDSTRARYNEDEFVCKVQSDDLDGYIEDGEKFKIAYFEEFEDEDGQIEVYELYKMVK